MIVLKCDPKNGWNYLQSPRRIILEKLENLENVCLLKL